MVAILYEFDYIKSIGNLFGVTEMPDVAILYEFDYIKSPRAQNKRAQRTLQAVAILYEFDYIKS